MSLEDKIVIIKSLNNVEDKVRPTFLSRIRKSVSSRIAAYSLASVLAFGGAFGLTNCSDKIDSDVEETLVTECATGETKQCGATNVGVCEYGIQVCGQDEKWGDCYGEIKSSAEIPDSLDNNCDGPIDEGFACLPGQTQPCGSDVGACEKGIQYCLPSGSWEDVCYNETLPAAETCNSIDDDCDELKDEDFPTLGEGCILGLGICGAQGIYVCSADGTGTECNATPGTPLAETCNNIDDDCDGTADEDFSTLGGSCTLGVGACGAQGIYVCSADGTGTECNATPGTPLPEQCDGIDNDCNGLKDDLQRQCGLSTVGRCEYGKEICSDGKWGGCDAITPIAEIPNGIDDDCDGPIDEGYECIPGQTRPCGSDVGACEKGLQNCGANGKWDATCYGPVLPKLETCNNIDDDCDWLIDESLTQSCYTGPAGTLGVGLCHGGTQTCSGGKYEGACTGEVNPLPEAYDGKDNDCDGKIDEDLILSNTSLTLSQGSYEFEQIRLTNNSTLQINNYALLNAANISIDENSKIAVVNYSGGNLCIGGKGGGSNSGGGGGGGCHASNGGNGGRSSDGSGSSGIGGTATYGSLKMGEISLGSKGGDGGGGPYYGKGSLGGGYVDITVEGNLEIYGRIIADGLNGGNASYDDGGAGAGSAGKIMINSNKLVLGNNASISAIGGNGGNGGYFQSWCGGSGGGGSGGIIGIKYTQASFKGKQYGPSQILELIVDTSSAGNLSVRGGYGGSACNPGANGQAGVIGQIQ